MLVSVEEALVGSVERRAPLKMRAWEAIRISAVEPVFTFTRHVRNRL